MLAESADAGLADDNLVDTRIRRLRLSERNESRSNSWT